MVSRGRLMEFEMRNSGFEMTTGIGSADGAPPFHSPFAIHHSPFSAAHSPFAFHHSPFPFPWIKICGVRTYSDLEACARAGATHVGLNLWPGSPRFVTPRAAAELIGAARHLRLLPVVVHLPDSPLGLENAARMGAAYVQVLQPPAPALRRRLEETGAAVVEARRATADNVASMSWGSVLLLDAHEAGRPGGTGRRVSEALAGRAPALRAGRRARPGQRGGGHLGLPPGRGGRRLRPGIQAGRQGPRANPRLLRRRPRGLQGDRPCCLNWTDGRGTSGPSAGASSPRPSWRRCWNSRRPSRDAWADAAFLARLPAPPARLLGPAHAALPRRSASPRPGPGRRLPQARGPRPHGLAQDQQRPRPGPPGRSAWARRASSPRPARASTAWPRPRPARSWAWPAPSTWARRTWPGRPPTWPACGSSGAEVVPVEAGQRHPQGGHQRGPARLGGEPCATPTTSWVRPWARVPIPRMVRTFQSVIGEEARAQFLEAEGRLPGRRGGLRGRRLQRHRPLLGLPRGPGGGPRGRGGRRDGPAAGRPRRALLGRLPRRPPRLLHLPPPGRGRPGAAHRLRGGGAGLPRRGPGAQRAVHIGPGELHERERREASGGLPALSALEGIIPALESAHAVAWVLRAAARGAGARRAGPPEPLGTRRQGHGADRRRSGMAEVGCRERKSGSGIRRSAQAL